MPPKRVRTTSKTRSKRAVTVEQRRTSSALSDDDAAAFKKVLERIKHGVHPGDAFGGIVSAEVWSDWMGKDALRSSVELVERELELQLLQALSVAATPSDVRKIEWLLEKRFPHRWGPKAAEFKVETTHKLQVDGSLCAELAESWQSFESQNLLKNQEK